MYAMTLPMRLLSTGSALGPRTNIDPIRSYARFMAVANGA